MAPSRSRARGVSDASLLLVAIVLLALALRIVLSFDASQRPLSGDPAVYDEIGVSIAGGEGWSRVVRDAAGTERQRPTAVHPPAWPGLLGATYAVTDHDGPIDEASAQARPPELRDRQSTLAAADHRRTAARIVTALLGAIAVALIGLVARELWGTRVGLVAAAVGAVFPGMAILGVGLESESLFVPVELGALYAVLRWRRPGSWRWLLVAGGLGGLAVLTRANGAILLVPLVLAAWRGRPRWSWRALAAPAAVLVSALLVVAPWTVRNADEMHATIPVSTNLGKTLAGTYNPASARDWFRWRTPRALPASYRVQARAAGEAARDRALTHEGLRFIRAHPLDVLRASFWNTARLLELDRRGRADLASVLGSRDMARAGILGFAALAVLALAGATTRRARSRPRWIWLVPVALWAATVPFAVNFDRFRAPIDPFLVMLAALALTALADRVARSPRMRDGSFS